MLQPSCIIAANITLVIGADYDMSECTPGDLDPHAVASIFKAYLRECKEISLNHTVPNIAHSYHQ